jgi:hypothetical protein
MVYVLMMTFLCGCHGGPTQSTDIARNLEEARVTSPNGRLDAVMVRQDAGGAAGGWEWNIYIVPKGQPVSTRYHEVLYAGTFRDEKLVWLQDHLLEVQYRIAHIHSFRNLWSLSEAQYVGGSGETDYSVEIRLGPSSSDFSLLTAAGTFKRKD